METAPPGGVCPTHAPVHHSWNPLPGAEGRHVLQLLVCDPGRNQQLLRVAGAEPAGRQRDLQAPSAEREEEEEGGSIDMYI